MSEQEQKDRPGAIAMGWWSSNIAPRDNAAARGLSARLRRGASLAVLCEPAVHELGRSLRFGPSRAGTLVQLACLLAELREHDSTPLARRLGGAEPVLSRARFERLIRAEGEELTSLMRRAILMVDRRCNVASLAEDLILWTDTTRNRWCFHYFGADAPRDETPNNDLRGTTE